MKVLISFGFGAGWSTWVWANNAAAKHFARTYKPIIDALERGEELTKDNPIIQQFQKEFEERFDDKFYLGGLHSLIVVEATPPFLVHEYDGHESIVIPGENSNWVMED